jgi:ParB/RepB/Spo0J family partition protein
MSKSSLRLAALGGMRKEEEVVNVVKIDLDDIIPDPSQPRRTFDPEVIEEMSNNLIRHGQLSPIKVRENPEGNPPFMVFDGEYRWRSAMLKHQPAQLEAIVYRGDVDPDAIIEQQYLMNEMRTDMPFQDRANFFKGRVERYGSVEAVAAHMQMNARRIWKVMQAETAGGLAGSVRDEGLSGDSETINAVGSLERQDPAAAAALVAEGRAKGRVTRKEVTKALASVKEKGEAKLAGQVAGKSKTAMEPPARSQEMAPTASPPSGNAVGVPRIVVRWQEPATKQPDTFSKQWRSLVEQGGEPYLWFGKLSETGSAWVAFGSESVAGEFPLDGLRIDRIVVAL